MNKHSKFSRISSLDFLKFFDYNVEANFKALPVVAVLNCSKGGKGEKGHAK